MARSNAGRTYVMLVRLWGVGDGWIQPRPAAYSSSPIGRSAARLNASRAEPFPIVLPSGGSTSSSRSPRSSSAALGAGLAAESLTGTWGLVPFSRFCSPAARYALGASKRPASP